MHPGKTDLKKVLPAPVRNVVRPLYDYSLDRRYERKLRQLGVDKKRLLIIGTIQKSGVHKVRFMLANYLRLASGTSDGPVSSAEMLTMFPNDWSFVYRNGHPYQKPTRHLEIFGLDDITCVHTGYPRFCWNQSKVLHLYRNPLDFAVSYFFWKFEYLPDRPPNVAGPVEVLHTTLEGYATTYLSYRAAAGRKNTNVLRMSYEELVKDSQACLSSILTWLGIPIESALVEVACEYSSKETVMQLEEKDGPLTNDKMAQLTGRFLRDGSIGQWKKYFDSSDVSEVEHRLNSFGIKLDEFVLEG